MDLCLRDKFLKRSDYFNTIAEQKSKQYNVIGNLRLLVFISGVAVTVLSFAAAGFYGYFSLTGFVALYLYLYVKSHQTKKELERARCRKDINMMYLERILGGWTSFADCGRDFADPSHPYTDNLDIFGPNSLFQLLCVANTYYGRITLKGLFADPHKNADAIKMRQEAVAELSAKFDFCQELQCEGMQANKAVNNNPEKLLVYAENDSGLFKKEWFKYLVYLLPAALFFFSALYFIENAVHFAVPFTLLLVQIIIIAFTFRKVTSILNTVYDFKSNLDVYGALLCLIEQEKIGSEYLNAFKIDMFYNGKPASYYIKKLEKIGDAVDIRFNPLLYYILNFVLLWDIHCVLALESWRHKHGSRIRKWVEAIGHYEAISSLAVTKHIHREWVFPVFTESSREFSGVEVGHPLIPPDLSVCNDISIKNNSLIITGSNMSGKTTFLRTVGINLVLAYSGAPVYAKKLRCSIMEIFTSMRVADDLSAGISTFYGELLRIKMIIEYSFNRQAMIYLIDEIFKGTNSLDRITGAKSVIKTLNKDWVIGMVSTHDFELCDLEKDSSLNIMNYHFREYYQDNEIKFDYKVHPGRCRTTNARYLMKMVGIDLVD